ncbi:MAG: nucleotidyltransferase domain-containing protein [Anaerolineae bacterium]|nr:MAG: nucleotidyltransferase domain-containing protein [Anaerolineae bacterium]
MSNPTLVEGEIAKVRRIVLSGLKGHAARVYLFGSRARGEARRTSDIDVAVLPLEPIPAYVLAEIRAALEESDVIYRVDLVNLAEADEKLRRRVEEEGILWDE